MKIFPRRVAIVALLCIALPGGSFVHIQSDGNFHPIMGGEAYRSAQPSAADLGAGANGINLRDTPYAEKAAASARLGLEHYDFGMSASKRQISVRFALMSIPDTATWPTDQSRDALEQTLDFTS